MKSIHSLVKAGKLQKTWKEDFFSFVCSLFGGITALHGVKRPDFNDHTCLDLLVNWKEKHQANGAIVLITRSIYRVTRIKNQYL